MRRLNLGALLLLLIAAGMNPLRHQIRLDDYANCTGTVDATSQTNTALSTAVAGGKTLFLPTGCVPTLASPTSGTCANGARSGLACTLDTTDQTNGCGIGATCPSCCIFSALAVQDNTHIQCEDLSAGFAPLRQYCSGGTYPGAACKATAECLGGGTCTSSFGVAGTSPCTAATCFAPTSGATYEMLRDTDAKSSDIFLEGCSVWTYQSDPYQRCVAGTNAGDPCRQECDGAAATPGARCEAQTDCAGAVPTTPVVALITAAGNITNGTHSWKVTFNNANGQGGVSATSGILTTDGTHGQVTVNIALGPVGTTSRKVYRRIAGDTGNWLLVGTQSDNTTQQFTDNVADASLGAAVPADTGSLCLRIADCKTPGGTCSGTPNTHPDATIVPPSGPGRINAVDLARTFNATFAGVNVWDHFTGDFGIKTENQATLYDTNVAREITDCSSPIPGTPANSSCFAANAGKCCYGAFNAATSNVQPTVAVTNGVSVGIDSQLLRVWGRGSTAGIIGGANTRIDESTIWPSSTAGPGKESQGYSVGNFGMVAKSYAFDLAAGATGIALTGTDATAIENKLGFITGATGCTGILMSGANDHATGNNIKGIAGSCIGISAQATNADLKTNYVEGSGATGVGILTSNSNAVITGNQVVSLAVETLQTGIKMDQTAFGATIADNIIYHPSKACIWLGQNNVFGGISKIALNTCFELDIITNPNGLTTALHPECILDDNLATGNVVEGNICYNGWRGFSTGTRTDGLVNTSITGNRFMGLAGAPIAAGGAGIQVVGNYINKGSAPFGADWGMTCDASCTTTRGTICFSDADCTGSCNAGVKKCNPDPMIAFLGSPMVALGMQHASFSHNIMYGGVGPVQQCSTVGAGSGAAIGQACTVSQCAGGANACNANTVHSANAIGVCATGGAFCCGNNGTPGTCGYRTDTTYLRHLDYDALLGSAEADVIILGNQIFSNAQNTIWLDFQSSASLGNTRISQWQIAGNTLNAATATATTAIKFPTSFNTITNIAIGDNNIHNFTTPASTGNIANYQGSFGSLLLQNGGIQNSQFPILTTGAQTIYAPLDGPSNGTSATETNEVQVMVGSGTVWKMTCQINATPTNTSTRAFTLRKNLADTTMLCTITNAIKTCTPAAGSASAPIAFTAGDQMDMKQVSVVGTALAAAQGTCALYVSYDTVM